MRAVKWIGWTLLVFIGVVLFATFIFALTFNANAYKSEIVENVRKQFGRELEISGDLRLSFFPPFTLESGHAVLYERDLHERFASMENLRLRVALMPLFSKKLQIDSVSMVGISVEIIRDAQGRFNIDDLIVILTPRGPSNLPVFFVDSVSVKGAQVRFRDLATASEFTFADLNGSLAPVAPAIPGRLDLNGQLKLSASTMAIPFDLQTQFTFKAPDAAVLFETVRGKSSVETKAGTLKSELKVQSVALRESVHVGAAEIGLDFHGTHAVNAKGTIKFSGLELQDGNAVDTQITLSWTSHTGTWQGEGRAEGTLKTGVKQPLQLSALQGAAKLSSDKLSAKLTFAGFGSYETESRSAMLTLSGMNLGITEGGRSLADIRGALHSKLDIAHDQAETRIDGTLNGGAYSALLLSPLTAPEKTRFKVNLATLDLDRMRRGAPSSVKPGKQIDLDLAPLRDIGLTGELFIGQLTYGGVTSKKVRALVD